MKVSNYDNYERVCCRSKSSTLLSLVTALALVFSMLAPGLSATKAYAAEDTIDTSKTGSITLYKYADAPDSSGLGDYPTQEEMEDWIESQSDLEALEGVVFSYANVGEIGQSTDNGTTTIGYAITNSALLTLLESAQGTDESQQLQIAFTEDEVDYYTVTSLSTVLGRLTQTQLQTFMVSHGTNMTATDENGKTTVANLSLGLYLIVETDYPATVTTTTPAFFVSIPMTDDDEWIYDVVAYPKNDTSDITITKSVVEDGTESRQIDAEIGQDKQFVIRADVPSSVTIMNIYKITDTLSDGLTYNGNLVVRGLAADGSSTTLTQDTDYTVSTATNNDGTTTLTINFTVSSLWTTVDNQAEQKYITLEITYNAYLNEKAVVGSFETNNVNLYWETDNSSDTVYPTTTPGITTYGIDLTKVGNGVTALEGVTFDLYRTSYDADNPDTNKITMAKAGNDTDGYYYYPIGNNSGVSEATLTTDANGKLDIRGLETGTYLLVETATNTGYNLLSEPIVIVITSNEGTGYTQSAEGTYAQVDTSVTYYTDSSLAEAFVLPSGTKTGDWINFGTSSVYTSSGAVQMYAAEDLTWSATVGGESATVTDGTISVTVNNQSGFTLPKTGGLAIPFLLIGGALVVVAGTSIFLVTRKKKSTQE